MAAVSTPALDDTDRVGRIEARGIEYVEPEHRTGKVRDLFSVFFAAEFCYAIMLFGALPLAFGLSWWSTITAITVGLAVGSFVFAPMALFGPRTGTNSTVSSVAHFGVLGRIVGSGATQLTAIIFVILTLWTGGLALEFGFHRLIGTPTGTFWLVLGIVVIWLATTALTVLGHATLVANFKFVAVTCGLVIVAMIPVFASHFHAVGGGKYALGTYLPTWILSATVAASLPISYGPVANDYARYLAPDARPRHVFLSAFGGMFIGCWVALVIGAFATASFVHPDANGDFVSGLMASSPAWFVVFLIYAGIVGNVANGALALYNATLDLHAITWKLRRVNVALLIGAVALAGTIIGTVVYDGVTTLEALLSVMIVTVAPWMLINTIGYLHCGGRYRWRDLHAFTWPRSQGRGVYWFKGGLEPRAFAAWIVAVVVGMLFISTTLITGPIAKHVGGMDFSFLSSLIVGGVVYELLLRVAPGGISVPAESAAVAQSSATPT